MDEHDIVVNISDELEKSIMKVQPYSSACCIYRVPPQLRSVNEKAYTPQLVSIGPLHHDNKSLQMMEETKMRFVKNFIRRPNVSLRECVKIVKEKKDTLHGCYHETSGLKDDDFVKIIVVDAIFIVDLFLTFYSEILELPVERERELDGYWVLDAIGEDLLLLENQLPFFILEDIWKFATEISIKHVFYHYWNYLTKLEAEDVTQMEIDYTPKHFVDLIRKLYIPHKSCPAIAKTFHVPSVIELHRAGVEFNVMESSKNLFDISFSKGILKIPQWKIMDSTEVIFRNLIAFEQCQLGIEKFFSHYHALMDFFVNASEDVDLLVEKKIIENWLGDSNEVSDMINKLGRGVTVSKDEFYFAHILDGLNKHCKIPCNKWMANLKQNYFNTPWTIISFVAALLLLILTIIQTVCSIISLLRTNGSL